MVKQYYGVIRSKDYLAHYGIKGMKWGIRKERIRNAIHTPAFSRVRKKLEDIQARKIKRQNDEEVARIQSYAAKGKKRKLRKAHDLAAEKLQELRNNANREYQRGQADQNQESATNLAWWGEGGALLGNKAWRIRNRLDQRKSRKRLTDKGHAKAVQERNAYARQYERMFRGTEYDPKRKRKSY